MPATPATVVLGPSVDGALVYLPTAPRTPGGRPQGRLVVEVTITNTSSAPLTATRLAVTFPAPAGAASGTRALDVTIPASSSATWTMTAPAEHVLFDLAPPPGRATVSVSFAASEPITLDLPLAPRTRPGDAFQPPPGTPRCPDVVHHSVEENAYPALRDAMRERGLSVAWISTHTIEKRPFSFHTFFTVVFRPGLGPDESTFHGLGAAELSAHEAELAERGHHVEQLDSYFSMRQGRELFAGVVAPDGAQPPRHPARTYHGRSYADHALLAGAWTAAGYTPSSVSVVSVKGTLSYTALWEHRGGGATFDLAEHLTSASLPTRLARNVRDGRSIRYLKGYLHQGATRYSAVWDDRAADAEVREDLRLSGFRGALREQRQAGHPLRSVTGYQLDGEVAFGGIWER